MSRQVNHGAVLKSLVLGLPSVAGAERTTRVAESDRNGCGSACKSYNGCGGQDPDLKAGR